MSARRISTIPKTPVYKTPVYKTPVEGIPVYPYFNVGCALAHHTQDVSASTLRLDSPKQTLRLGMQGVGDIAVMQNAFRLLCLVLLVCCTVTIYLNVNLAALPYMG